MQEYPASKSFSIVFGTIFFFGGLTLAYFGVHNGTPLIFIPAVILATVGVIMYLTGDRLRVTVNDEEIARHNVFKTRIFLLKEIDGYRTGPDNAFVLVAKDGRAMSIPTAIVRRDELLDWIKTKYEDVDQRQNAAETEVLLENETFGPSRADRAAELAKAKLVSRVGTVAAIALGACAIFWDSSYSVAMAALFLMPWVAVYLVWSYKGLLRLSSSKKSPYPSIFIPFVIPILVSLIEAIGYRLYGFPSTAWLLLVIGTGVLTYVALTAMRAALNSEKKGAPVVVAMILSAIYTWALLVYTNCHYDKSAAVVFHAQVTGKHISSGRSTSYYLMLGPWGTYTSGKEESVAKSLYRDVAIGDSVRVRVWKGRWNIPWYTLSRYPGVLISPRKAAAAAHPPAVEDRSPVHRAGVLSADRYGK